MYPAIYCQECGAALDDDVYEVCGVCGAKVKRLNAAHAPSAQPTTLGLANDNPYASNTALHAKSENFSDFLIPNILITPFACLLTFGFGGFLSFIGAIFAVVSRIERSKGDLESSRDRAYVSKILFWFVSVITIIAMFVIYCAYGPPQG